jgi:hypothetical protein
MVAQHFITFVMNFYLFEFENNNDYSFIKNFLFPTRIDVVFEDD